MAVVVRVLGEIALAGPDGRVRLEGEQARRLLGALVVSHGRPVTAESLERALWDELAPAGPAKRLRMPVSRLRQRLDEAGLAGTLRSEGGSYHFRPPQGAVDADAFERDLAVGRELIDADPASAREFLISALDQWRGEAFAPFAGERWALRAGSRLNDLRHSAEEDLVELELSLGLEAQVIDRALAAVEQEPLRERRWIQLATALRRLHRQAEALRSIDRARSILRDEVGLDIGAELLALERMILVQQRTLAPSGRVAPPPRPNLIARGSEIADVEGLLHVNRLVTVVGLGGVGKSAVVSAVSARWRADGRRCVTVSLDGIGSVNEVLGAIASAAGLWGLPKPDDLLVALAGRLDDGALLVLDGAEDGRVAVADLLDRLLLVVPDLTVLASSRVALGAVGEVRYPLEPLAVGTPTCPGPAQELFLARAGFPSHLVDQSAREHITRICERVAGLPLALELTAAVSDVGDLGVLAERARGVEAPLAAAISWSIGTMPAASRDLLLRCALLPDGASTRAAGALASTRPEAVRSVLGPLVQARLLEAVDEGATGVRYRSLEPVRQVARRHLGPDEPAATKEVLRFLLAEMSATGELFGPPHLENLPGAEAELGNVRHWLARTVGSRDGLELAAASARIWGETGAAVEGIGWIERHLSAADAGDDLLRARARVACAALKGVFGVDALDGDGLKQALDAAEAHDDALLWLSASAYLALARGWAGDLEGAYELLNGESAHQRLAQVDGDWIRVQRQRLLGLGFAAVGDYAASRSWLAGLSERFLAVGDPSSALETLFIRAWMARAVGDFDAADEDLAAAVPWLDTPLVRRSQALIRAELAYLARHRGDPSAAALLAAAIVELDCAADLRLVATHRRDLAAWHLSEGHREAAFDEIERALPVLLDSDRRGAAVALAIVLGAVDRSWGTVHATLSGAAHALREDGDGPTPSAAQLALLKTVTTRGRTADPVAFREGVTLADPAILTAVGSVRADA